MCGQFKSCREPLSALKVTLQVLPLGGILFLATPDNLLQSPGRVAGIKKPRMAGGCVFSTLPP